MPRFKKAVTVVCVVLAIVGFFNFCIFLTLHDLLGGEAHHIENGHYFLWSRYSISLEPRNSRLTEVSSFTYYWMLWQQRSLYVTHPLGLIAIAMLFGLGIIKAGEKKPMRRPPT